MWSLQGEKGKEKLVCVLANGISIKTSRKRRTVPGPARHKRAGTFFQGKAGLAGGTRHRKRAELALVVHCRASFVMSLLNLKLNY